jgi:serine/threonine protein kinase
MENETFDENGNVLTVGNYKFFDGILGSGSFGTVRLAELVGVIESEPLSATFACKPASKCPVVKRRSEDGSMVFTMEKKHDDRNPWQTNPDDQESCDSDRHLHKSSSAPFGKNIFEDTTNQVTATSAVVGQFGLLVKHGLKKASENLGLSLFDEKEPRDNKYAIKIFNKSLLKKMRTMERDSGTKRMKIRTAFEQVEKEIALMKKMHHPNIVSLFEVIDSPESDILYLVMEYMPLGEILTYQNDGTFRRLKNNVPGYNAKLCRFNESTSALFFVDILHGLAYLHQHRIIHRDLKPENIL